MSSVQRLEVNCRPLSVTMEAGTPNLATQVRRRVLAQLWAVINVKGTASIQRDHRKEVGVPLGVRQRANQVQVESGEAVVRHMTEDREESQRSCFPEGIGIHAGLREHL